jgi:hypothetical protein
LARNSDRFCIGVVSQTNHLHGRIDGARLPARK